MEVARYKSRPRLRPHTCRHGQRHFRTRRRPSSFLKIAVVEPARPLHSRSTSSPRSSLRGEEGTLFDRGEGKKKERNLAKNTECHEWGNDASRTSFYTESSRIGQLGKNNTVICREICLRGGKKGLERIFIRSKKLFV